VRSFVVRLLAGARLRRPVLTEKEVKSAALPRSDSAGTSAQGKNR
jgi:hypothetical protein